MLLLFNGGVCKEKGKAKIDYDLSNEKHPENQKSERDFWTFHSSSVALSSQFVGCILNSVTEGKDKCAPETGLRSSPTVQVEKRIHSYISEVSHCTSSEMY